MDDTFNISLSNDLSLYEPYRHLMPTDQSCFLQLLDHIGVLHEDNKQLYGKSLEIISLVVNLEDMTISMSHEAKQNLNEAICDFILNTPDNKQQQPLQAWLRILGHANWALNAFPILKPTLNSSYDKILGKMVLNGIQLFEAEEWSADEANLEIWSDASKDGLGFWAPKHLGAFFSDPILHDHLSFNIFLNEAITILTAIHWSSTLHPVPSCLVIHTDSSNSFNMFNSLHASDPYNSVLMLAASI